MREDSLSAHFAMENGEYCEDWKEWLQCACGQWVHEQCLKDVTLDEQCLEDVTLDYQVILLTNPYNHYCYYFHV